MIELNQHRLLHGDATNREDVDRLIGDCKVNLLLTDPPYGIDIVKIGGGQIGGQGGHTVRPFQREREREREQWHQSEEQNHQPSKQVGTVGIPARPGFKMGGANCIW